MAQFNAGLDISQAKQLELDTRQNIESMREEGSVYESRQKTAYAASGVLTGSGSPLAVQAATAGKFAQRINQQYLNSQATENRLYSEATAGIYEGAGQAAGFRAQGTAALLTGGAKVAGQLYQDFDSGVFN